MHAHIVYKTQHTHTNYTLACSKLHWLNVCSIIFIPWADRFGSSGLRVGCEVLLLCDIHWLLLATDSPHNVPVCHVRCQSKPSMLICVNHYCFSCSPQNAARIVRALFEIALRKRWPAMTYRLLTLCKVIDKRLWDFAHPLRQFPNLSHVVLNRLEEKNLTVDKLKEMRKDDIGKCSPVCVYLYWCCLNML